MTQNLALVGFLLAFLQLVPCLSAQSSSSSPSSVAKVTVALADLEALQSELISSKKAISEAKTQNEKLSIENSEQQARISQLSVKLQKESDLRLEDSRAKEKALTELQGQLTTVSALLSESNARMGFNLGVAVAIAALAGLSIGIVAF